MSPSHNILPQDETDATDWEDEDLYDEGFEDKESIGTTHKNTKKKNKSKKPSIMSRFAKIHGFRINDENHFSHDNGSCIKRSNVYPSLWERQNESGELVLYYFAKDHCLEKKPLEIGADIWGLIEKFPEKYALILLSVDDVPIEIVGINLNKMKDIGQITLHPATYRIVYE